MLHYIPASVSTHIDRHTDTQTHTYWLEQSVLEKGLWTILSSSLTAACVWNTKSTSTHNWNTHTRLYVHTHHKQSSNPLHKSNQSCSVRNVGEVYIHIPSKGTVLYSHTGRKIIYPKCAMHSGHYKICPRPQQNFHCSNYVYRFRISLTTDVSLSLNEAKYGYTQFILMYLLTRYWSIQQQAVNRSSNP